MVIFIEISFLLDFYGTKIVLTLFCHAPQGIISQGPSPVLISGLFRQGNIGPQSQRKQILE